MIIEPINNVKQEISIMKIIPSILAIFGTAQAGYSGPDIGDCGFAGDINAQIVRELGKGTFKGILYFKTVNECWNY